MFFGSVMKKRAEDKLAVYSFMCDVSQFCRYACRL